MSLRRVLQRFAERHGNWRRAACAVRGHEYPNPVCPACYLHHCARCGREILGRTLEEMDQLAPLTEEISDLFDLYDSEGAAR